MGYGVDIVDIHRFERVWRRFGDRLLERFFSDVERDWCLSRRFPAQHLAARFGAKEAFVKAMGTRSGFRWKDVEVVRESDGRPVLRLAGRARDNAGRAGVKSSFVSMAHDAGVAVASVILEGEL